MEKLLNTGVLMVLVSLLAACQEETASDVSVDNISLIADSASVPAGEYAELVDMTNRTALFSVSC